MIFMNFIIAVINDSYTKINSNKVGYDYIRRIRMIYKYEVRLSQKDF